MPRFEARMAAETNQLELLMYGPIGTDWWGDGSVIDAKAVAEALREHRSATEIVLRVASVGGDPLHAMAMYSALRDHPARKMAVIEGICASAATLVTCACDSVDMSESALFMIHEAEWGGYGRSQELQAVANAITAINENAAAIYAAKSKQSIKDLRTMMAAETWMTAAQAKEKGFVDSTKPLKAMSASARPGQFWNVPDALKSQLATLLEIKMSTTTQPVAPAQSTTPAATPVAPAQGTAVPAAGPSAATSTVLTPAAPQSAPAGLAIGQTVQQPDAAQMAAQAATKRAADIAAACALAGHPQLASKWIEDPNQSITTVQAQLLSMVCSQGKPTGDLGTTGAGSGTVTAPNPNAKFEAEYTAAETTYAAMGISKDQYVASRRRDEGLDKAPLLPKVS